MSQSRATRLGISALLPLMSVSVLSWPPAGAEAAQVEVRVTKTAPAPVTRTVVVEKTTRQAVPAPAPVAEAPPAEPQAPAEEQVVETRREVRKVVTQRKVAPFSQWVHEGEYVWFGHGAVLRVKDDDDNKRAVLEIKNEVHHGRKVKVKLGIGESAIWTDVPGQRFRVVVAGINDPDNLVWIVIEPL